MNKEAIKNEIHLTEDECCIIFDFGCYFPYSDFDTLTFNFSLGMDIFVDYKINHRYPNKNYQTITKIYGRRVSRLGYPYIMKLNEQTLMLLCLNVGIKECWNINLIFPLQTNMTKDKPICELSLRYLFDEGQFYFSSREKTNRRYWANYELNSDNYNYILLNTPEKVSDDSNVLVYNDTIEPCPLSLRNPFI